MPGIFFDKLVARRAKYDKMGEGNMPITTKQILDLLKYNFDLGVLEAQHGGISLSLLLYKADDTFLRYFHMKDNDNFGRTSKFRGSGFTLIGEGPSQNAYGLSELVGKDYSSGSSGKLVQKEKGDGNSSG